MCVHAHGMAVCRIRAKMWSLINSLFCSLPQPHSLRISPLVAMAPSSNPFLFMCLCRLKGMKNQSTLIQGRGAHPLRKVSVCNSVCVCVSVWESGRERECVWDLSVSLSAAETELHLLFMSHTIYWPHFKFVSSTVSECLQFVQFKYRNLRQKLAAKAQLHLYIKKD